MSTLTRVNEIADPQGGRNMIRSGDLVRVLAGDADKRGFDATFRYGETNEDGKLVQVTVAGSKFPGRAVLTRTLVPTRIRRLSQAHAERKGKRPPLRTGGSGVAGKRLCQGSGQPTADHRCATCGREVTGDAAPRHFVDPAAVAR